MPPAVQQSEMFTSVELHPAEREVWRSPENIPTSQWAAKHRVVTDGPWQGLWRNENTPYLVEPMDTFDLPHVREVVVVGTPQSGKTQILYNCWAKRTAEEKSPSLIVLADETTAKNTAKNRLTKIIKKTDRLSQMMTGRVNDLSQDSLTLQGATTAMAWASSVPRLQTDPFESVYQDEVDSYPDWKGEADSDPVSLADARTTTYKYTGKRMKVSTCTRFNGYIWRALMDCQEKRVYMARCPSCGEYQIMYGDQMRWPEGEDPHHILAQGLAWYECNKCGEGWLERERRQAVSAGRYGPHVWDQESRLWLPAEKKVKPVSVGFHFSSFYSPFVSLAEIASKIIGAKDNKSKERDLYKRYYAIPWVDERAARVEDSVLRLCDEREPDTAGIVPEQAAVLFAFVDVHDWGLVYTIRAWAPGPERESWLVRAGVVESFGTLEAIMFRGQYLKLDGSSLPISFGLMDSGYQPKAVCDWCAANPPFRPSRGDTLHTGVWKYAKVASHPGLLRYDYNSNTYKDDLARKLNVTPGNPGMWHLHTNKTGGYDGIPERDDLLKDYAKQLCAEAPNEHGEWKQIGSRPNHYLDCEVGQLVMVDITGLAAQAPPPPPQQPQQNERRDTRQRPAWFNRR